MTTHRTRVATTEEALEELLDLAEDALDHGDPHRGIALCAQVLQDHPNHAGALFVTADAYRDLGFLLEAEQAYRRVTSAAPNHAPAWSGLSVVLFEQLRFEEARRAAMRSLRLDRMGAEAAFIRGMVRERNGDTFGAERDFVRASRIDPAAFPPPVVLGDDQVLELLAIAAQAMNPVVQAYLEQVPVLIEQVPPAEVCRQFDPPAPASELLGVFNAAGIAGDSGTAWSQLPSTIVLYRANLQRLSHQLPQLLSELRVTVLLEVAHFLGIADEDLEGTAFD